MDDEQHLPETPSGTTHHNDALAAQLRQLTDGLLYISESEYPIEVEVLAENTPIPDNAEIFSVEEIFGFQAQEHDWHSNEELETAQRYQKLILLLNTEMTDLKAVKSGDEAEKKIVISGCSPQGNYVLLTTYAIET